MKWLIGACIALAGAFVGFLFAGRQGLKFSETIDLGDVLNAVATLLVAILVGYVYAEASSSKAIQTKLLMQCVDDIRSALADAQRSSEPCHSTAVLSADEQLRLKVAEREHSNAVYSLELALSHCKIAHHSLGFDKLKEARVALKDSLTDTPYPGPFDAGSQNRINVALKTMRDELNRVAFEIARR